MVFHALIRPQAKHVADWKNFRPVFSEVSLSIIITKQSVKKKTVGYIRPSLPFLFGFASLPLQESCPFKATKYSETSPASALEPNKLKRQRKNNCKVITVFNIFVHTLPDQNNGDDVDSKQAQIHR